MSNLYTDKINVVSFSNLTGISGTIANPCITCNELTVTNFYLNQSRNFTLSQNITTTNSTISNISITTISASSVYVQNVSIGNIKGPVGYRLDRLTGTNVTITDLSISRLSATGLSYTNASFGYISGFYLTYTNNISIVNLSVANSVNVTGALFANNLSTNLFSPNRNIGVITNVFSTSGPFTIPNVTIENITTSILSGTNLTGKLITGSFISATRGSFSNLSNIANLSLANNASIMVVSRTLSGNIIRFNTQNSNTYFDTLSTITIQSSSLITNNFANVTTSIHTTVLSTFTNLTVTTLNSNVAFNNSIIQNALIGTYSNTNLSLSFYNNLTSFYTNNISSQNITCGNFSVNSLLIANNISAGNVTLNNLSSVTNATIGNADIPDLSLTNITVVNYISATNATVSGNISCFNLSFDNNTFTRLSLTNGSAVRLTVGTMSLTNMSTSSIIVNTNTGGISVLNSYTTFPPTGLLGSTLSFTSAVYLTRTIINQNNTYRAFTLNGTTGGITSTENYTMVTNTPKRILINSPYKLYITSSKFIKNIENNIPINQDEDFEEYLVELFKNINFYKYKFNSDMNKNYKIYYGVIAEQLNNIFSSFIGTDDYIYAPNVYNYFKYEIIDDKYIINEFNYEVNQENKLKITDAKNKDYFIHFKYIDKNKIELLFDINDDFETYDNNIFIYGTYEKCPNVTKDKLFELNIIIMKYMHKKYKIYENDLQDIENELLKLKSYI